MNYINIAQIAISVIIVGLILLQERESGLSGLFGGGDMGGVYQARRGLEKGIFIATIVLAVIFVGLSIASLILK
ncbi:MAG: preprotein translocase subunit SecG [Candidatus Colwellbacteria bacterium CG_4_9_14_0_2_um_filter_50_12]|uniref:Protein-export membrane protein SecG n=1 Tax=Candidatus Colwellbacteria bacterium CG_4_9_14_0_2_um_filter_50_12 TaxID=1974538 RepID=A0A2M8G135_9BACT|nr:MAG: preprotein translocase subunit SecG [Candidatus Colwellbacteria bacterium CG_4_9_14_0_2_um_filter_50_12]